jgi:DNA-binding GntR family transcriptional regulator
VTGPVLDNRPLHVRAEEALVALLESGAYRPGDQLPPEPELAQRLGISRSTLREVMRTFEERGLIIRRQGVGTFVNHASPLIIDSGLETLESVERGDLALAHARADILPVLADEHLLAHLDLEPGTVLLLLEETLYTVGGEIIGFSRNYFVPEFFKFHVVRRVARKT